MRATGIKETMGIATGSSNRGFNISWKCPNCKYKSNDSIIVVSDFRETYNPLCDKCGEIISIKNPHHINNQQKKNNP